jgi:DNA processing protein
MSTSGGSALPLRLIGPRGPDAAGSGSPEAERLARVVLSCGVEPGDLTTSRLIRQVGAREALEAQLVPKPGSSLSDRLREVDPVRQLEQAHTCGIRFLVPGDAEWPVALDDLAQAPRSRGSVAARPASG